MKFVKMPKELRAVKKRLAVDFSEKFIEQPGAERENVRKSFEVGFKTGFSAAYLIHEME